MVAPVLLCAAPLASAGDGFLGREALTREARRAWWDLRSQSCAQMVDALGKHDPMTRTLRQAWLATSLCEKEIRREFLCELPDAVLANTNLLTSSVDGAWENRAACLPRPASRASQPLELAQGLMCGFGRSAKNDIERAASCIGQLKGDPRLRVLFEEMVQRGCKAVSRFAVNAIMAFVTRGTPVGHAVGKWVSNLASSLTDYDWQAIQKTLGANSAASAVTAATALAQRYPECGDGPLPLARASAVRLPGK
jgi:hypothetical protein